MKREMSTGGGNVTPTAEHNFMCDPESADQVLKELHCKITVVGFEVCNEATVDWVSGTFCEINSLYSPFNSKL